MNLLYIAFSCHPDKGSESAIGWNIPLQSAKYNCVHVITREENREAIDAYQKAHPRMPVHFHYVGIPSWKTRLYRNLWTPQLNALHRAAYPLAAGLCKVHQIQLIHQITPIELRSIGDYGRIPGVKFLWGPIGGGESIPKGLLPYGRGCLLGEGLRWLANQLSVQRLKGCRMDGVLYVNEETKGLLKKAALPCRSCSCISEVGIAPEEIRQHPARKACIFLTAGRLRCQKGHALLLDALCRLPKDFDYQCWIVGEGPRRKALERRCEKLGLKHRVRFLGRVPYRDMPGLYAKAAAVVMPSLREATGTVLMEAMANSVPVIAARRFGAAVLVTDTAGWLYEGTTREEWVQSLTEALLHCGKDREEKGVAARRLAMEHAWPAKAAAYQKIYEELVHEGGETDGTAGFCHRSGL